MLKSNIDHEDKEARAYNWVLLATFVLLMSLLIQTPARVASHFMPNSLKALFHAWGGSIWSGQVNGQYQGVQGQLRWQFQPSSLLRLSLGVQAEVLTAHSHVQGVLRMGVNGWQLLDVKGQIAPVEVQGLLSGWQLPNTAIELQQLTLNHQKDSWSDSKGTMSWQGGALDYVFNGQRQHVNLPPVIIAVQGQQSQLIINLQEQQGANLASFILTGKQLESRLTQRLLMYSPNYHGVAEPDAIVVTASQPLNSL